MLFNSLHFLVFFPLVCVAYFLLPSLRLKNLFLLVASYYFYMNWEPVYALLLFSSTLVTYLSALGVAWFGDLRRKKLCLVVAVVLNLAMLGLFKYYAFAARNIAIALARMGVDVQMPQFSFLLPVGISFYIFQALGYAIDVYRGKTVAERNFFTYALFVSFFPQLVAGPIERSTHLLRQFKEKRVFDFDNVMAGFRLMAWGYFLKLVMADRCALYVDGVFENVMQHNGGTFVLASLIFPFQIYGDFAGYSLVAIGAARVMGFRLMENFHRPYLAITITDFWRRWHISLSTWFKDYVYIPLGGNRVSSGRHYVNILVTFVVSGIWHGANWTFLVWGAVHGVVQCMEKWLGWTSARWNGAQRLFHGLLTFCVVALAWVFFRANDLADAFVVLRGMFTDVGIPYFADIDDMLQIALAILVVFAVECVAEWGRRFTFSDFWQWVADCACIVVLVLSIALFGVLDGSQFIYFQF